MDFRHLIVTCLFSKLRLPFDNQKVKENYAIFFKESPEFFRLHVEDALKTVQYKRNKLIFLKSWNEWGEGNYMEPDLTFGKGYINALHEALNSTLGK